MLVAAEPSVAQTPIDPRVEKIFELMDKNSDGSLSKAECLLALRKQESVRSALGIADVTAGESRDQFESIFAKMDADESASISLQELNDYLAGALPAAA